jgi:hypothetical protein
VDTPVIVAIVVIALLVLAAVAFFLMRKRSASRSEALRDRFGPEYDRRVEREGSRKDAERRLEELAHKRDALHIRTLSPASRTRYQQRWTDVQPRFVDDPVATVNEASTLLDEVMRERGYPVDDFDAQQDLVAADHPQVAESYRTARDIQRRADAPGIDRATTEELRTAFVHYRSLFSELLGDEDEKPGSTMVDVRGAERAETPRE